MSKRTTRYVLLAVLAVVIVLVGFFGGRFWRLARQARQLQVALREVVRHPEATMAGPARKQFSPGFLQMAFGDNPALLTEVQQLVADGLRDDPPLGERRLSLMLVSYRQDGGAVRDVAIRLVGVPGLEEKVAAVTGEAQPAEQAAKQVYQMGKSLVGVLGNNIRVLAAPAVAERERRLTESVVQGESRALEVYLREPVRLVAVVPDPDPLVNGLVAVLLKGEVSLHGATGELAMLGYDPGRANQLAQFLTDSRMLASGLLRIKFTSGPVELMARTVTQAQIAAEGPAVVVRATLPGELMEVGLPHFVKGLSKALRGSKEASTGK